MKTSFRASGDGFKKLQALGKTIAQKPTVRVGFFGGVTHDGGSGLTNAELAAIHEFGAPGANIPKRSFMRATADLKRQEWNALLAKAVKKALAGQMSVDQSLGLVGERALSDIRAYVQKGNNLTPLMPATIKAKGSSRPLIDTGRLMQSMTYEVVRGR